MDDNKSKALAAALSQIEKQFGKGSIMKMDAEAAKDVQVVSTGSLGLDLALGVGGYILANQRLRFPVIEESTHTIKAEFSDAQAVIPGQGQTIRVAGVRVGDIGDVELELGKTMLPQFKVPDGYELDSYIDEVARRGLERRLVEKGERGEAFDADVYREQRAAGYTAVGEFHYLGYHEALAAAEAAEEAGVAFVLLYVAYAHGGLPRFRQGSAADYLREVESLRRAGLRVALAPHSVRACPRDWLEELGRYGERAPAVLHVHADEQPREIEECLAEHGRRPIELLADCGCLGPRTTVIHATHADDREQYRHEQIESAEGAGHDDLDQAHDVDRVEEV